MGGGGKSSDAPDAPDYVQAAEQQGIENRETARLNALLNNPNYYTPWGSQTVTYGETFDESAYNQAVQDYQNALNRYNNYSSNYQQTSPLGPSYGSSYGRGSRPVAPNRDDFITQSDQATVNIALDPADQQLLDAYRGLALDKLPELQQTLGTPFDFESVTDLRDQTEAALMDRLNPYLDRDIEDKRTQLLQAGFTPGSEAWTREMDDFNRRSNDARLAVIGQAGTEQDRALAAASYLRGLPLQEINALRTGGNITQPSFPGFQGASAAPVDIMGATTNQYNADIAQYNADAQSQSGLFGGLTNLASAAAPYVASSFGMPGAGIWSPTGSALSNAGPVQLTTFGF